MQSRKFGLVSRNLRICSLVGIDQSPPARLMLQSLLDAFGSAILTILPFVIRDAYQ